MTTEETRTSWQIHFFNPIGLMYPQIFPELYTSSTHHTPAYLSKHLSDGNTIPYLHTTSLNTLPHHENLKSRNHDLVGIVFQLGVQGLKVWSRRCHVIFHTIHFFVTMMVTQDRTGRIPTRKYTSETLSFALPNYNNSCIVTGRAHNLHSITHKIEAHYGTVNTKETKFSQSSSRRFIHTQPAGILLKRPSTNTAIVANATTPSPATTHLNNLEALNSNP